jgi:hypothetical protein
MVFDHPVAELRDAGAVVPPKSGMKTKEAPRPHIPAVPPLPILQKR